MLRPLAGREAFLLAVLLLGNPALTPGQEGGSADLPPLPDPGQNASDDPARDQSKPRLGALEDDFESDEPSWRREVADSPYRLKAHERSGAAAYDGDRSERFDFSAGPGSHIYYSYALPRIPISNDLRASLYVRSNRSGIQLLARVVLPADVDPDTGLPFVVTIAGSSYEESDRWSRLEVTNLVREVERQVWILRAKTRRTVRLEGAYLERLALNLFGGPGDTEVFVDGLRVAPVASEIAEEWGRLASTDPAREELAGPGMTHSVNDATARVQLIRNRLSRYDDPTRRFFPWVPSIIHAPGADVTKLRQHGFDVYASPMDTPPASLQEAAQAGFLLMPMLGRGPDDLSISSSGEEFGQGPSLPAGEILKKFSSHPIPGAVAFWHLDEGLGRSISSEERREQVEYIRQIISGMRDLQIPGLSRLTTAGISGESELYARRPGRLDLVGVPSRIWGTATEPLELIEILRQRQALTALSNPEALVWTWIPATAPADHTRAVWGNDTPPDWGRVQILPEQIRLMTYAALAGGARALAFSADASLTEPSGQANLIELALLNAEIDLFESVFAQASGPARLFKVYPTVERERLQIDTRGQRTRIDEPGPFRDIKAAAFETPDRRSTLLLLADYANDAQIQPGQLARSELKVVIPGHQSANAWEVSLGGVQFVDRKRVPGGLEITLKDFGPTAMVLVTSDLSLKERLRSEIEQLQATSIELALQQAELQLRSVTEIQSLLAGDGHDVVDSGRLISLADEYVRIARAAQARGEMATAWNEARRVARPLRILRRLQYENALEALENATYVADPDSSIKTLVSPISAPTLCSFNTLPQHWEWVRNLQNYPMGSNMLPAGDFEESDADAFRRQGWLSVGYETDGLATAIQNIEGVRGNARESTRMLKLSVRPADPSRVDQIPPFQEHPVVAVQSPPIRVKKHQFVRISVCLKSDRPTPMGAGGIIVRDSMGGSWLQFRKYRALPEWTRVVLYRRAPADTDLTVTIGLASTYGDLFVDDLRIERAVRPGPAPSVRPESSPADNRPIASSDPSSSPSSSPTIPRR